ncbi:MAG: hypothetical protein QM820_35230 [Minicystis sp.]
MARSSYLGTVARRAQATSPAGSRAFGADTVSPVLAPPRRLARAGDAARAPHEDAGAAVERAPAKAPAAPPRNQVRAPSAPVIDHGLIAPAPAPVRAADADITPPEAPEPAPPEIVPPPQRPAMTVRDAHVVIPAAAPRSTANNDPPRAQPEAPRTAALVPPRAAEKPAARAPVSTPVLDRRAGLAGALDTALRWVASPTNKARGDSASPAEVTPRLEPAPVAPRARLDAPPLQPPALPAPRARGAAPPPSRTIHIGSIDVQIQPPPRATPPEPPPRPAARESPAAAPAPLARGFTSAIGLRQG